MADDRQPNNEMIEGGEHIVEPEVESGLSPVATMPGKNIAIIGVLMVGFIFFMYSNFFASDSSSTDKPEKRVESIPKSEAQKPTLGDLDAPIPTATALPEPPPLVAPDPPEPIQTAETLPSLNLPPDPSSPDLPPLPTSIDGGPPPLPDIPKKDSAEDRKKRLKASIMVGSGSGGEDKDKDGKKKRKTTPPPSPYFIPGATEASQKVATSYGTPSAVIAQGKIIDAVLETAIDTDLPGNLRAVVSRDVYAESGKNVLIPKGSRLVGTYAAKVKRGQSRVDILWSRIIRPDGIDIDVSSPGVDELGRAGTAGVVDNRYFEIVANAILLSTVTVSWAAISQSVLNTKAITSSTTTNTDGSTTSTKSGTSVDNAVEQATEDLGKTFKDVVKDSLNVDPKIMVPQGTRVKVFVNHDLIFPAQSASQFRVVE